MTLLAKREKEELLQLARRSLTLKVRENRTELETTSAPALTQPSGAFVTLHSGGELRGCIGRIRSHEPLYQVIQEMAVAAGLHDPRFPAVTAEELETLHFEISVLSPPQVLRELGELKVGEHGLIISFSGQSGLLLPQVATEYGWDAETFLRHTCMKAGLSPETWRRPGVKVEIFSAQVFAEGESLE